MNAKRLTCLLGGFNVTKKWAVFWMAIIIFITWTVRWRVVAGPLSILESDESVPGLMAMNILRGDRPVFYWGQYYLGAIEMYATAFIFSVAGVSSLTFKFVPIVNSVLFIVTLYLIGRDFFNRRVGVLSAGFASVALLLVVRGVKGTGYGPVLVFGNLALWRVTCLRKKVATVQLKWQIGMELAFLGGLCGLAFWAHPMGVAYILPIIIWLIQCSSGLRHSSHLVGSERLCLDIEYAVAFISGSLVGMSPFLLENIRTGWMTFHSVEDASIPLTDWLTHLIDFRVTFPILLGFLQPTSNVIGFWDKVATHRFVYWLGLVLGTGFAFWALVELIRVLRNFLQTRDIHVDWVLLYTLMGTCCFAILSRFASLTEPRYLLPLYSCIPFLIGRLEQMHLRQIPLACAVFLYVGLSFVNIFGLMNLDPNLNLPCVKGQPYPVNLTPLIEQLERENIDAAYADYWICYRLMFEAQESVKCAVIEGLDGGWNRYPHYASVVENAPNPAWIFVAGSEFDVKFRNYLSNWHVENTRMELDGYSLYLHLNERLYPGHLEQ